MSNFDWNEYADDMAARETEGKRQISFDAWCESIANAVEAREARERSRFEGEEDGDVCF